MNTKEYIDTLFSAYQENTALKDFKEELQGYLDEQIANLIKGGMDEKRAFEKALKNLGDISAVADEISLKKKQEVLSERYMKTRNYMKPKRSALFALCGLILGVAMLLPFLAWFASGFITGAVAVMLPFGMTSVLGFIFLGLTQESATHEAMQWKRASLYVLSAGLVLFGTFATFVSYFGIIEFTRTAERATHLASANLAVLAAISITMLFVLPGIALGIFLILTEKDRSKPWVTKLRQEAVQRETEHFGGPVGLERFGLICGALWIAAISGAVLLTMLIGFKFSWLPIAVALVIQLIIIVALTKSK